MRYRRTLDSPSSGSRSGAVSASRLGRWGARRRKNESGRSLGNLTGLGPSPRNGTRRAAGGSPDRGQPNRVRGVRSVELTFDTAGLRVVDLTNDVRAFAREFG